MFLLNMNILLSFLLFVIFPKTIGQSRKNKACEMLIVVDDTLYQSYGSDDDRIINLVDEHIDELNKYRNKSRADPIDFYIKRCRIQPPRTENKTIRQIDCRISLCLFKSESFHLQEKDQGFSLLFYSIQDPSLV